MTVDELIEELQRMPNKNVRVCVEDYDYALKRHVRHEVVTVSWQGSHVRTDESPREMP